MIDLNQERPHSEIPQGHLESLAGLAENSPRGNFLELGVYKGGSAWVFGKIALEQNRKVFLFDTFEGLPENGMIPKGRFNDTTVDEVQAAIPNAQIFKGLFPLTLTREVKDLSFVHIDCDLLAGCKTAIELLWPRMVEGGIMAFDDWTFPDIQGPVISKFGLENIKFTEKTNIAFLIKTGET